jgi:hypothetical protein
VSDGDIEKVDLLTIRQWIRSAGWFVCGPLRKPYAIPSSPPLINNPAMIASTPVTRCDPLGFSAGSSAADPVERGAAQLRSRPGLFDCQHATLGNPRCQAIHGRLGRVRVGCTQRSGARLDKELDPWGLSNK